MSEISGIGLRGETEFFRRNNNRLLSKQKRIRTIKLKSFHLFFILIIFVVTGFMAFKAGEFIMGWEKLRVDYFTLINSPESQNPHLRKILKRYHVNILSLNFQDLREDLLNLREVEDVALSRKLPATIEIRFFLRQPVCQMLFNERYRVLDKQGIVLYESSEEKPHLITIKGVEENDWKQIVPLLPEITKIKDSIDYVSLKKPYGITLKLKGINEMFYPGERDYAKKINYYLKLKRMKILEKYRVTCVDLRFDKRLYLEYEEEVSS